MRKVFAQPVTETDKHKPEFESPPGVPRWVKILAISALIFLLLFAFFRFTGIAGDLGSVNNTYMSAFVPLLINTHRGQLL